MKLASPLYIYPSAKWDPVLARKPLLIVANPASGPGASASTTYATYLAKSAALGIENYGYVDLDYMNIPLQQVFAWVDAWVAYYPGMIHGIFYDELDKTATPASLVRAKTVYDYAKKKGLKVILNPGTKMPADYLPYCDHAMVFEGTAADYIVSTRPAWELDSATQGKAWHCVHSCTAAQIAPVKAKMAQFPKALGWVTPDIMPNPYDGMVPGEYLDAVGHVPAAAPAPVPAPVPAPTPTPAPPPGPSVEEFRALQAKVAALETVVANARGELATLKSFILAVRTYITMKEI